ncbi:hypothetical protein [Nonomuraea roseola]|uniref:DUF998 domain-containing protein n=1 Tax=Nonomuraea roseola TaxID=46179 RepID=A0ABV5Q521_9ACTN
MDETLGGSEAPKQQPSGKQKQGRRSEVAAVVSIFALTFIWPYTEEFLEAIADATSNYGFKGYLPWVDGALTFLIIVLAMLSGVKVRWTWAVLGLALTVGSGFLSVLPGRSFPLDLVLGVCDTFAFAVIALAVLGVRRRPGRWRRAKMTPAEVAEAVTAAKNGWQRFHIVLPLVVGMLAAFTASTIWDHLLMKSVEQEYFAQVSQIIPLLLIAVGFEARFFDRLRQGAIERTLTLVTVITLCVGEALAISALTVEELHAWHEYAAFIGTVQAWSVALVTLLWALTRSIGSGTDPADSQRDGTRGQLRGKTAQRIIPGGQCVLDRCMRGVGL